MSPKISTRTLPFFVAVALFSALSAAEPQKPEAKPHPPAGADAKAAPAPAEKTFVVQAGDDQTLILPAASALLSGRALNLEGGIASYKWSKVSGGEAEIQSDSTPSTRVSKLAVGAYTFRLTATTTEGKTGSDDVVVTVSDAEKVGVKRIKIGTTDAGELYRPDMTSLNIQPGDVLIIPAGEYPQGITLGTFSGSAEKPVTILNDGGLVKTKYIRISNAKYFKLSGTGSDDAYGFKIVGEKGNAGVGIGNGTSDYEVEGVEVGDVEAGFYFKIQPHEKETQTQYPNWNIRNVKIHDDYIHDTTGEGMYIGHTYPNADPFSHNLVTVRMDHVHIYNNRVENTGWDGIQLSNARENAEISQNTVKNFGTLDIGSQQAGIILGGNTNGVVYNNSVDGGAGNGLQIFGYGVIHAVNNTIKNSGRTKKEGPQDSVYINDPPITIETNPALRLIFQYNTIYHNDPQRPAIRNASYHGSEAAGEISHNTIYAVGDRPASDLIKSGSGDTIVDNTIKKLEK